MSSSIPDGTVPAPATARRRASFRFTAILALIALADPVFAVENLPATPTPAPVAGVSCGTREAGDTRPRIGLALGGGGARGFAHISVLRKIEELHIPIDCIAGTSMGSLVGGFYASGMSVDDMEKLVTETDWEQMFNDALARPERSLRRKQDDRDNLATVGVGFHDGDIRVAPGLLQGERAMALFERVTIGVSPIQDFDRLPIPFRAVATDLNTGEAIVLDHGSLALAMRASMSLPGIFAPVEIDGRLLLDGGLVNQVPVDVVRDMGADIVIAVDVGTPLTKLGTDASLLQVVSQITGMMTTGNTRRQLANLQERDVLIVPELGDDVATGDFTKAREALDIGALAATAAQPELAALSVPATVHAEAIARRPQSEPGLPVVEFVRLENHTPYADEMLLGYLDVAVGERLDADHLDNGVLRIYGLGTIASTTWEVVEENGRRGVLVRASEKEHGPNYLQLGLEMNADFDGTFESNVTAAVLMSPISPLGAEARFAVAIGSEPGLQTQVYLPLDIGTRWLLYGRLGYDNPDMAVYNAAGENVAVYDVQAAGLELRAGREFGNVAFVGLGYKGATGDAELQIGSQIMPDFTFNQGTLYAVANVDRLDSLSFPRDGYFAELGYSVSRDGLGSDSDFDQLDLDVIGAHSFGLHALQYGGRYHVTTSGFVPIQARYRLGGRTRLVGYRLHELTGQHYALMFAGYSYQLAKVLGRSAQIAATFEYGNAWERREDMDFNDADLNVGVYAGYDSRIGPMLFGLGWREHGNGIVFMEIGRPF